MAGAEDAAERPADDDRVQEWVASLGRKQPTATMLSRYMNSYKTPCDRLCCHAFRCGEIRCRGCSNQIQRAHRFVCMHPDCSPDESRAVMSTGYYLCENCFKSPGRSVHPMQLGERQGHAEWCRISWPDGVHVAVHRDEANVGTVTTLAMDDLPLLSDQEARSKLCPI